LLHRVGRTHGAAKPTDAEKILFLRSNHVCRPLDESLYLHDIVLGQFACKVRHALIRERPFEHHVLEIGDFLGRGVAKILDIPTFVDALNAMTESTVRTLRLQQACALIRLELRERRFAADGECEHRARSFLVGRARSRRGRQPIRARYRSLTSISCGVSTGCIWSIPSPVRGCCEACWGCKIGRRHVKTLMKRMGIEALYRRPRTTKPEPGHKIYPYLLRGTEITQPNQVWAMDITYIPMERGFVYLAVVLDWATRRVLSWRLSITMEAAFCVETLEDALARHGKPEVFNTDQGSQFTGSAFTGLLTSNSIAISMDGKGAWRDNVFVERLWRSVKYEEVYLRAYETVDEARHSIGRYLDSYNGRRPHSSLDEMTPDQAYFNPPSLRAAA
jgi:putative transposase